MTIRWCASPADAPESCAAPAATPRWAFASRMSLPPVLAVGGHLKNTVAIGVGQDVFLSQHIGDLETLEARGAFEKAIDDLVPPLQFQARSRGLRSASRLRVDPLGGELGASADPRAASSGACCRLRRGKQCAGRLPRRLLGWHRIRPRRRHLGRRIFSRGRESVRAHRAPASVWSAGRRRRGSRRLAFGRQPDVRGLWRPESAPSPIWAAQSPGKPRLDEAKVRYMLEHGINVVPTTSVGRLFDAVRASPAWPSRTVLRARPPCSSKMKSALYAPKRRIL